MRWMICLLIVVLGGCHGLPLLERSMEETLSPVMPLWERYKQCLVTTDPTELIRIIDLLEGAMLSGTTPPSWMKAWGQHVMSQPLRASVDPQALSAACTIRAAAVMVEAGHLTEARSLYRRVQKRYAGSDRAYYVGQAQEALGDLQASTPVVVVLRARGPGSR